MKNFLTAAVTLNLVLSPAAFANETQAGQVPERVAHYQGKQAATLDETLSNLRDANARLKELLDGPVADYDMHDIHSLSYTLEDAVADLSKALAAAADDLESMHFYSEGLKRDEVLQYGNAYLKGINRLVK